MPISNITRFTGDNQFDPRLLPAPHTRAARQMEAAVEDEAAQGVIAAVRIERTAYVARTGLDHVAALTAQESELLQRDPQGAERYQAIIDAFAGTVITEVARMNSGRGYGR